LALVDACPRTMVLEAHQAALLKEVFDREVPYYIVEGGTPLAELDPALEIPYRSLCVDYGPVCLASCRPFEKSTTKVACIFIVACTTFGRF
jgi:ribonuclease J